MNRLSISDLPIGEPIQWDCFDVAGTLLLRKGIVVTSARQIAELIERGLFVTLKASSAKVNLPPLEEKPSPFHTIEEFKSRLSGIFEGIVSGQGADIPARVLKLAKDLQAVCYLDADAVLGVLHLDTQSCYTITHPLHVSILTELIARRKNIPFEERQIILAAALTANVAMSELQEQLHKHDGPLSEEQKAEVRLHPSKAVDLLLASGVQDEAWITSVLHHHEKIDGSGYPGIIRGEAIPPRTRIIALADTYSAMVTPRVYRAQILARDALREIFLKRGGEMDEELAQLFIKELGVFPPGTFVKLQNGEIGIVTRRNGTKPIVQAVTCPRGAPLCNPVKRNTGETGFSIREMVERNDDLAAKLDVPRLWGWGALAKYG